MEDDSFDLEITAPCPGIPEEFLGHQADCKINKYLWDKKLKHR
jgi:hypothetical protein